MLRNLGGSVGIALLSTLVTRREQFHSVHIGETVTLLPGLGNVGSSFGKILTVVLLLVDDFFVVRYVSWIGHT